MNLSDALRGIADQLSLDCEMLQRYAHHDPLGGFNFNNAEMKFTVGSIWGVEGQVLYALVRALQPNIVAEIGGWVGCSASHLAAAVRANRHGEVFSVEDGSQLMHIHGCAIPWRLRSVVQLVRQEGTAWLREQPENSIDLLFEDASHSTELTYAIAALARSRLKPGGILVNHDVAPTEVGYAVRAGLDQAGIDYRVYVIDPSNCGIAIWRKEEAA